MHIRTVTVRKAQADPLDVFSIVDRLVDFLADAEALIAYFKKAGE